MRTFSRLGACFVAVTIVLALPALGGTIYRWVDDEGKVHFSDVVPQKYLKSATPVAPPPIGPSPEQQRQAAERAAKDKALADEMSKDRASRQPSTPAPTSAPPASTPSKRPPVGPDESTDCETWRSLYRESLECFAPFRTARGGTKAEAFDHCTAVPEPPLRCGTNIQ